MGGVCSSRLIFIFLPGVPSSTPTMSLSTLTRLDTASKRPILKCTSKPTSRQNYDRATGTVQLEPGDAILLKQDAFQGKRKMKDRWGDEEYEVVCQVSPDMPAYEVHNRSGNATVVHRNRLFLVASVLEPVTPLSLDMELLEVMSEWSTLVELTPLECESDSPEMTWEALTRRLTCWVAYYGHFLWWP